MIDTDATRAADIMTKAVVAVGPDTSIGEIAALLLDHGISAVPVIDEERRVLGIVSEGDLLGHPPSGSPRSRWLRLFDRAAVSLEDIATARHRKACDVMTRPVVTVAYHTPVAVLAAMMHRRRLKRVPILRGSRLVGIVSRSDVLPRWWANIGRRESGVELQSVRMDTLPDPLLHEESPAFSSAPKIGRLRCRPTQPRC